MLASVLVRPGKKELQQKHRAVFCWARELKQLRVSGRGAHLWSLLLFALLAKLLLTSNGSRPRAGPVVRVLRLPRKGCPKFTAGVTEEAVLGLRPHPLAVQEPCWDKSFCIHTAPRPFPLLSSLSPLTPALLFLFFGGIGGLLWLAAISTWSSMSSLRVFCMKCSLKADLCQQQPCGAWFCTNHRLFPQC